MHEWVDDRQDYILARRVVHKMFDWFTKELGGVASYFFDGALATA